MKKNKGGLDMTDGKPTRLLIMFALPMMFGALFDLMYNMVDAIVLGRFVGAEALASVGATTSTTGMIIMIGHALTNSVAILVSQAWGAKDEMRIRRLMGQAVGLCIVFSLAMGGVSFVMAEPMMRLLGTPENIRDGAVLYIQIICGMGIARMMYNTSAAVLRAIGDSRAPLFFLVLSSVLNIVLDLLFVVGLGMTVAGVAWATVIAQLTSAIICCIYMWKKYPLLHFGREELRPDGKLIAQFVKIALPMALTDVLLTGGQMVISGVINGFGSDVVAAYTVGGKVDQVATIVISQLASASAFYTGQNYGARLYDRIGYGVKSALILMEGITAAVMVVLFAFGRPLALLFVNASETEVISNAMDMIRIEAAFLPALCAICLYNSALRGMGLVKPALASGMLELASKVGFSIVLSGMIGPNGVWLASPLGWVIGLCMSAGYFYFGKWKQKALAAEG